MIWGSDPRTFRGSTPCTSANEAATLYIWAVSEIRLLFLGDIVGKPGRELVRKGLPSLIEHYDVDLVIANAENAAAGRGITREIGDQLLGWGVDVMTSGNHIWAQREAVDYIGAEARLLRPANFPAGVPGNGSYLARTAQGRPVGVINVMGRVFMQELDNPFTRVLEGNRSAARAHPHHLRRLPRRGHVGERWPWAGISTARSPPSSARTPTCRPQTSRFCRAAPPI